MFTMCWRSTSEEDRQSFCPHGGYSLRKSLGMIKAKAIDGDERMFIYKEKKINRFSIH